MKMTIANGEHRVRITGDVGVGARDDGNNFVAVEAEFLEGGHRLTYFGNFGDEVTWTDPRSGKTMTSTDFTVASLRAAGFKGDDYTDYSSMTGHECTAVIDQDKNGNPRIKKFKGQGGVQLKSQLSPAELKVFAAKMRQKIAGQSAASAPKPAPTAPKPDDTVPF